MKILLYSDLHLEFGTYFKPPIKSDADLMILAGDIITFEDFDPLTKFLQDWDKPVLYIAGNHEYYTSEPMQECAEEFKRWANERHPNIKFLENQAISYSWTKELDTLESIHFFGGTMWTDFNNSNLNSMILAKRGMNDYRYIKNDNKTLTPSDTVDFHKEYVRRLIEWFETPLEGKRVVISHHAPCTNPNGFYKDSALRDAYNSLDMLEIIERYKPAVWVYGHTHSPDDQIIGETRVISNPRGYPLRTGGCECKEFKENGVEIII